MKKVRLIWCVIVIVLLSTLSAINLKTVSATAPIVITLAPTDITATSARLWMSVNANGKPTKAWFGPCQGMSEAYFEPTGKSEISTSLGLHELGTPITGLKPSTSYSYQALAQNSDGDAHGECLVFTTSSIDFKKIAPLTIGPIAIFSSKPTVAVLQPTNVTSTTATLRASINPNNSQTTYTFMSCDAQGDPLFAYFQPSSPATLTGTQTLTVTYVVSNIAAGRNYSYKIIATNTAGTSTSSCMDFSTAASVQSLPPAISLPPTISPPTQTSPPPQAASGVLTIVSNVSSYTIHANGAMMGTDSGNGVATIYLVPGQYNIVLRKSGCSPASLSTSVPMGISQVQIQMTCQSQTTLPPTQPATQAAQLETKSTYTIPPTLSYGIDNNTLLLAGMGLIAVLLVVLIVVMLSRGKRPPRIYSSR